MVPRPNDNWCRFVTAKLTDGCGNGADLLRNDVRFVTFNYDRSLERQLRSGLSGLARFNSNDIETFLSEDRITHVYGAVEDLSEEQIAGLKLGMIDEVAESFGALELHKAQEAVYILDQVWQSGKMLLVIDPEHKNEGQAQFDIAKRQLIGSSVVYILGYGFDENNTERLGLREVAGAKADAGADNYFMFTNFGDSKRVSKAAGRALCRGFGTFLGANSAMSGGCYFEMSTRDVYQALSLDFDDADQF
jgi:hypothetical protein